MKINSVISIFIVSAFTLSTVAQSLTDAQLSDVRFDQNLNAQISLNLPFRDESGKTIQLRDYFGTKPVVLVLGYYQCPMLCTLTFNGMVEAMNDMKWSIGDQFNVVHVSINPRETAQLAAAKKQTYLRRYGRPGAATGWHFLTGDEPNIRKLADEVGFHYAYDPTVKQYAHPSGLVILTPDGKVSKYFFGVTFSPSQIYAALQDASQQKVGSPIERLVLLCFHYSPIKGKYGALIMIIIRVFAVITLLAMGWLFFAMRRNDRSRRAAAIATANAQAPPAPAQNLPDL